MFGPKSDMSGIKNKQKKPVVLPRIIGVAAITLLLIWIAPIAVATPSSDYAVSSAGTTASQAIASAQTRAENAGALFMVGLITGMVSGITLFFIHLRRREKHLARFNPDDMMLDNWPPAADLPSLSSPSSTTSPWDPDPGDEMIEKSEPWERSVDWWKDPDNQ